MTDRVLIIEDDERLAGMVSDYLGAAGFEMTHAANGVDGLAAAKRGEVDAVILDLMLPDIDGLEVCRTLRSGNGGPPILMLTAKGDPMDRVVGLELGADDYLPKPFEPRELLARLRAILRRGRADAPTEVLHFGRLEIDIGAMEARLDGEPCSLTAHQFRLLEVMARAPGRVLTRDYLMDMVTGGPLDAFDRSIDVHVSRIRAEIEDDPKRPRRLLTVRGAGYVFAAKQD
ncbi:response regulator transcription factor [Rhodobacteraceae bacterium NNCM2]|nr:response regulator transcription factor [Coraliihabitans acroporae]